MAKKKPDKICKNILTAKISPDIIIIVKGNPDKSTGQEVSEMEIDSMTQTELASYLETLARLVEATAKDPQDAARIIREAREPKEPKRRRLEPAIWPPPL